jgi:hypothetical protein
VLGARYFGDGPTGSARDLILDWHGSSARLDQYVPGCDGGCLVSNKDTPIDAAWHRYVIEIDVRDSAADGNGQYRLSIDGQPITTEKLPFSLSNPTKAGFQIGATYSSGNAGGSIAFDDVVLSVTPR